MRGDRGGDASTTRRIASVPGIYSFSACVAVAPPSATNSAPVL